MAWVPWVIGLSLVVIGVPVLGALGVGALAVGARIVIGALGPDETPEEPTT